MRRLLALPFALSVAACSAGTDRDEAASSDDEIVLAARCERDFGAPLRAKVAKARTSLDRSTSSYGAEVRRVLDEGRAKVLPFCAMAPEHFEHFRADVDLSAFGKTAEEQR